MRNSHHFVITATKNVGINSIFKSHFFVLTLYSPQIVSHCLIFLNKLLMRFIPSYQDYKEYCDFTKIRKRDEHPKLRLISIILESVKRIGKIKLQFFDLVHKETKNMWIEVYLC